MFHLLEGKYLHRLFGIWLGGLSILSYLLSYSIIYLQQYVLIGMSYILSYNPILTYLFVAPIVPILATGSSFSRFLCPFDIQLSLWGFFYVIDCFLSTSLLCFRPILCISSLSPRISHFWFLYWVLVLELGARCAHHYWGVTASRFSQLTEQRNTPVYTHINKYFYM